MRRVFRVAHTYLACAAQVGNVDGEETAINALTGALDTAQADGIEAWWLAVDAESGIASYSVAVGTSIGGQQVLAKTSVGVQTNAFVSGFDALEVGSTYYLTLWAQSGAGTEVQRTSVPFTSWTRITPDTWSTGRL